MAEPSSRFPIVAYLNQGVVFDLIAMLEGGIANIAAIKTTENAHASSSAGLDAKLGVSNVFSLFGINLSARGDRTSGKSGSTERSEERVYTPNSLFDKLRRALYEQGTVVDLDLGEKPSGGDFVEFRGTLRKNSFLDAMERLNGLGRFIADFEKKPTQKVSNAKGSRRTLHVSDSFSGMDADFQQTMQMVSVLISMFQDSATYDVVADTSLGHQVVIALDRSFLTTTVLDTLIDGEFKILGKVLRRFESEEAIDLLRNLPIRVMPKRTLEELAENLNSTNKTIDFNLPRIETSVSGPALLISPIGIFT